VAGGVPEVFFLLTEIFLGGVMELLLTVLFFFIIGSGLFIVALFVSVIVSNLLAECCYCLLVGPPDNFCWPAREVRYDKKDSNDTGSMHTITGF
jgi:hypothetical protein